MKRVCFTWLCWKMWFLHGALIFSPGFGLKRECYSKLTGTPIFPWMNSVTKILSKPWKRFWKAGEIPL
jgi:hypothetical protein